MARQHGDHIGDDEGGRGPADQQSGDESHAGHAAQHRRRLPYPGHQWLGRQRPAGLGGGALKSRTVTRGLAGRTPTPRTVPAQPPLPGSGAVTSGSPRGRPAACSCPFAFDSPQRSPPGGSARRPPRPPPLTAANGQRWGERGAGPGGLLPFAFHLWRHFERASETFLSTPKSLRTAPAPGGLGRCRPSGPHRPRSGARRRAVLPGAAWQGLKRGVSRWFVRSELALNGKGLKMQCLALWLWASQPALAGRPAALARRPQGLGGAARPGAGAEPVPVGEVEPWRTKGLVVESYTVQNSASLDACFKHVMWP